MSEIPNPPDLQGCRSAQADRLVEGRRIWSLDLCQTARASMDIRPESYAPDPGDNPYWRRGLFEPRTEHPVRAVEITHETYEEGCRFHYGHMTLDSRGYFRSMFASQPFGESALRRVHASRWHIKRASEGRQPAGYWYCATTYDAPRWTEVHYASAGSYCGTPA